MSCCSSFPPSALRAPVIPIASRTRRSSLCLAFLAPLVLLVLGILAFVLVLILALGLALRWRIRSWDWLHSISITVKTDIVMSLR